MILEVFVMGSFKLHGMLLGVASAATQIEGDCKNTNWYDWYLKGKIMDNSNPDNANKHYQFYKEDALLMKDMGIQVARIGIEWARIEPSQGFYDEEAINHYKEELKLLNSYGIKPLVTIWHFNNPLWFEKMGGFLGDNAISIFMSYAKKVIEELGDYVESWVTLNEPNVYGFNAYFEGTWPPGEKSLLRYIQLMNVFTEIHIQTYNLIHQYYPNAKVGTSLHVRVFDPIDNTLKNKFFRAFAERLFQKALAKNMNTGKACLPFKGHTNGRYYDFIGLNYYSRSMVEGFNNSFKENSPKNDLGWEIYPEGLYRLCNEFYELYKAPIYITENGTCDNHDEYRSLFIYDHLNAIHHLEFVERYYHWCFIDNWEWVEGESARFGIVHNDFEKQVRTIKKSGHFFKEIIEENGVTEDMYERYVKDEQYRIY